MKFSAGMKKTRGNRKPKKYLSREKKTPQTMSNPVLKKLSRRVVVPISREKVEPRPNASTSTTQKGDTASRSVNSNSTKRHCPPEASTTDAGDGVGIDVPNADKHKRLSQLSNLPKRPTTEQAQELPQKATDAFSAQAPANATVAIEVAAPSQEPITNASVDVVLSGGLIEESGNAKSTFADDEASPPLDANIVVISSLQKRSFERVAESKKRQRLDERADEQAVNEEVADVDGADEEEQTADVEDDEVEEVADEVDDEDVADKEEVVVADEEADEEEEIADEEVADKEEVVVADEEADEEEEIADEEVADKDEEVADDEVADKEEEVADENEEVADEQVADEGVAEEEAADEEVAGEDVVGEEIADEEAGDEEDECASALDVAVVVAEVGVCEQASVNQPNVGVPSHFEQDCDDDDESDWLPPLPVSSQAIAHNFVPLVAPVDAAVVRRFVAAVPSLHALHAEDCTETADLGGDKVRLTFQNCVDPACRSSPSTLIVDWFAGSVSCACGGGVPSPVIWLQKFSMRPEASQGGLDITLLRRYAVPTVDSADGYAAAAERVVELLNKRFAYVEQVPCLGGGVGIAEITDKSVRWLQEGEFTTRFKSVTMRALDRSDMHNSSMTECSVALIWLKSLKRTSYTKAQFLPYAPAHLAGIHGGAHSAVAPDVAGGERVFNTFRGFAIDYDDVAHLHTPDRKWLYLAAPILYHVYIILAGADFDCFCELLCIAAHMLQRPGEKIRKHLSLQELTAEGVGRSFWGDLLLKVVGPLHSAKTSNIAQDLFKTCKLSLDGKLLCDVDEMGGKLADAHLDDLKDLMSSETMAVKLQRKQAYDAPNRVRFMFFGNGNQLPPSRRLFVPPSGERYTKFESGSCMTDYFKALYTARDEYSALGVRATALVLYRLKLDQFETGDSIRKARGGPVEYWFLACLRSGTIFNTSDAAPAALRTEWHAGSLAQVEAGGKLRVGITEACQAFQAFGRTYMSEPKLRAAWQRLAGFGDEDRRVGKRDRKRVVLLPTLADCIRRYAEKTGTTATDATRSPVLFRDFMVMISQLVCNDKDPRVERKPEAHFTRVLLEFGRERGEWTQPEEPGLAHDDRMRALASRNGGPLVVLLFPYMSFQLFGVAQADPSVAVQAGAAPVADLQKHAFGFWRSQTRLRQPDLSNAQWLAYDQNRALYATLTTSR
jgi:hypothetical protein